MLLRAGDGRTLGNRGLDVVFLRGINEFVDRDEGGDAHGDVAPDEGQHDIEGEVGFRERVLRKRQEGPDWDHSQAQAKAETKGDVHGTIHRCLRVFATSFREDSVLVSLHHELASILLEDLPVKILSTLSNGDGNGDDWGHTQREEVSRDEGIVLTKSGNVDHAVIRRCSERKPADEGRNHAAPGANHGAVGRDVIPGKREGDWHDSTADAAAHHHVHPAETDSEFIENRGDDAGENRPAGDGHTRHPNDLLSSGVWIEVTLVHVVRDQRGYRKLLAVRG